MLNIQEFIDALEEIQQSGQTPEEGMTADEIAAVTHISSVLVRKKILRPLADTGRLQTAKRRSKDVRGQLIWVPVYRVAHTQNGIDCTQKGNG